MLTRAPSASHERRWDDLVNDAQIPPGRYIEIITAAALSALGAPVSH